MADGTGFGHGPFGHGPFGHGNWTHRVLYLELPPRHIAQDRAEGGYYEKFVLALAAPMNTLRRRINGFAGLRDPLRMRLDLLRFYGECFGLKVDAAEPEGYQRTAVDIYARFLLIKGKPESFVVLAKVHGFDVVVQDLWFDGTAYTATQPPVVGEVVGEVQ